MRTPHPIRSAFLAAAFVAALGFGATAALASAPAAGIPACNDPYASGSCGTQAACQRICDSIAPGLFAYCNTKTYCCSCIEF